MNINQVNIESWTKLDKVGQSCRSLIIINCNKDSPPGIFLTIQYPGKSFFHPIFHYI